MHDSATRQRPAPHPAPKRHVLPRRALPAALAVAGLAVGAAAGAGVAFAVSDPRASAEYQSLEDEIMQIREESSRASLIRVQRQAELDRRETAVAAREQAVTAVEAQVAARSIGEGVWTVGVDVEPGTYRTEEALTSYCYWAIYRSGTNGADIIDNDGPKGGFPTVTLSEGQDFENSGCGTFVRQ